MKSEVSVVHLVYIPYGVELFERFLNSYVKRRAGIEHKLVILFNGFSREDELNPFLEVIDCFDLNYETILSDEKYDISSYFFAARNLGTDICRAPAGALQISR